jgi:hypothetical protein
MCWGARRLCALPWETLPPGSDNENRPAAGDPRAIEPWGRSRRPPPAPQARAAATFSGQQREERVAAWAFGGAGQTPGRGQQAAFLTAAGAMLQRLSYVQRYAWFGLEATSADGSMGLFRSGPVATTVGRAFEAAG